MNENDSMNNKETIEDLVKEENDYNAINQNLNSNDPLPQILNPIDGQNHVFIEDIIKNPQVPIAKTPEEEYNEILLEADTAFKAFQYSKAGPIYHSAIDKSQNKISLPLDSKIYLYDQLSICYEKQNKCKESIDYSYIVISQYNQKHVSTYQRILSILLSLNEIQKAKELIEYIKQLFQNETRALEQFDALILQIDNKDKENILKALTKLNKEKQRKWFRFIRNPLIKFSFYSSLLLLGSFVLTKYTYKGS